MQLDTDSVVVAIVVNGQVVDFTDDVATVRTTAALLSTRRHQPEHAVLMPITDGRRVACRQIAAGSY